MKARRFLGWSLVVGVVVVMAGAAAPGAATGPVPYPNRERERPGQRHDAPTVATAPQAAPDTGYPCTGDGVYLYDDINYGGACLKWTADDPELGDDGFHDRTSSIRFVGSFAGGRYKATLYEHHSYTGASTTFTADDPWLGDDAIGNDRADSIRIETVPFCDLVSEIPKAECEALVAFYNRTFGPYWINRSGWLATYTPCSTPWYGVTCGGGRVTGLHLVNNGLAGTLPDNLGNLAALKGLSLPYNQLTGSLPASLGDLASLEYLFLTLNRLTGGIPTTLGKLGKLRTLNLEENELSGSIPDSLGNLTSLFELDLHSNQLTGSIPPSLGYLSNLKELHVNDNDLTGPIPDSLGNLTPITCTGSGGKRNHRRHSRHIEQPGQPTDALAL